MADKITELQAKHTNALRMIVEPYLSFKLYIKFKDNKVMTLYGNEFDCTYKQCLYGHVKKITLDRLKGYQALLNYVEKVKQGKYIKAIIYRREPGEQKYNTVCRRYFQGQIEEINDPVLTDEDILILDYQIINNQVVIKPPGTAGADDLPDFKTEVNNSLNKK